jgi:hypothetical protein
MDINEQYRDLCYGTFEVSSINYDYQDCAEANKTKGYTHSVRLLIFTSQRRNQA